MTRSLKQQVRYFRYGLLCGVPVFALLVMLFSGAFAKDSTPSYFMIAIIIAAVSLVIGWLGFRLQIILIDPFTALNAKTRALLANKTFEDPVRLTEAHMLPSEMHDLLVNVNQLVRELNDRDAKLETRQAELERLRKSVSVAREAKSNFISNINHEVRTPLNSIIGFSGVLADQLYGPLAQEYLDCAIDIKKSGNQLLSLLSDIIALSRAELGTLDLKMEQFNAVSVIEKMFHLLASEAEEHHITMKLVPEGKLPSIIADRVRFMQIMQHVLVNAIRYNKPDGSVTVYVSAEPANNHVHFFRIIVKDTGVGITNEQVREIFDYFSPMEKGFKNHNAGKGLGLPLVKKLVEVHNGSLHIDSGAEGTSITINLISDPGVLD